MDKTVLNDSRYLFQRCPNGSRLTVDSHSIIIDPDDMYILPRAADEPAEIPSEGRWMHVSGRPLTAAFGMANLVDYSLEEMNRQVFHLGIYGTFRFQLAHLSGLRSYLLSMDQASPDEMMVLLQPDIKPQVAKAMWEVLGERMHDYREIRDELLPDMSEKLGHVFFRTLLEHGLCMQGGSFCIMNISRPVIKRSA